VLKRVNRSYKEKLKILADQLQKKKKKKKKREIEVI